MILWLLLDFNFKSCTTHNHPYVFSEGFESQDTLLLLETLRQPLIC